MKQKLVINHINDYISADMISTECLSPMVDVIKKYEKYYNENYIHSLLVSINAKICNNRYGVEINEYTNRVYLYIKINCSYIETGLYILSFVTMIDHWLDIDTLTSDESIIYKRLRLLYKSFINNKKYHKEYLYFKPIKYYRNNSVIEFKNNICFNYIKNQK